MGYTYGSILHTKWRKLDENAIFYPFLIVYLIFNAGVHLQYIPELVKRKKLTRDRAQIAVSNISKLHFL